MIGSSSLNVDNLRSGVACTVRWARRALLRPGKMSGPCVLAYHRVVAEGDESQPLEPGMWVTVDTFEEQLQFLREAFEIVPLAWLVDAVKTRKRWPDRACAVTFDDGWRDTFTNALPVLLRLGVPATVFAASDCVRRGVAPWFHSAWETLMNVAEDLPGNVAGSLSKPLRELSHARQGAKPGLASRCMALLKALDPQAREEVLGHLAASAKPRARQRNVLNGEEMRLMESHGLEFGAHSRSHPILCQLQGDDLRHEVHGSKCDLEETLGHPVRFFAYPNGDWNAEVRRAVVAAGFDAAFTTAQERIPPNADTYALPRIGMHEGISRGFSSFSRLALETRLGVAD